MGSDVRSVIRIGVSLVPCVLSAAIAIGIAEATILLARRHLAFKLAFVGRDIFWMAPLAYAVIFLSVLVLCLLLGLTWKQVSIGRLVLFAIGFLGTVGLLYTILRLRLHAVAVVVLAAGIGYQLSRMEKQLTVSRRLFRLAGLVGVALVIAACFRLTSGVGAAGGSPSPSATTHPNILLLVWDTVRELNLSLYGYQRPTTPFLQRWAAKGVVFDRAFATSSWTLPSHASLFTGRFPHELSVDFESPLDGAFPTLAEVLRARGYRTAGFAANPFYTARETGLARGFEVWQDYRLSPKEFLLSAGAVQCLLDWRERRDPRRHDPMRAPEVTDGFLSWLDRGNRPPFFAFLNYFDAHLPYYAPPGIVQRFAAFQGKGQRYDAAIASLDAELERILAGLEARGLLDRTIVVVTSDHGEQFGDHGLFRHANSLYRQVLQVPLVVVAPGRVPAGLRVPFPVSLRNVPATLLDLAGIPGHPLPGESHTRFWRDTVVDVQDQPVLSELTPAPRAPRNYRNTRGELRSLLEGSFHYILNADGTDELFDLQSDPLEVQDLKSSQYLPLMAMIRRRLHPFDVDFPRKLPVKPVSN